MASLFFDLYKAFDKFERSHKSEIFYQKSPIILQTCATCSEFPSNISTMYNGKQQQHGFGSGRAVMTQDPDPMRLILFFH